ncbi:Protein of unknown function [Gryllus bimaculatus]|nr:Protein of unknown function [Gryllus bimaculatus]
MELSQDSDIWNPARLRTPSVDYRADKPPNRLFVCRDPLAFVLFVWLSVFLRACGALRKALEKFACLPSIRLTAATMAATVKVFLCFVAEENDDSFATKVCPVGDLGSYIGKLQDMLSYGEYQRQLLAGSWTARWLVVGGLRCEYPEYKWKGVS